MKKVKMDGVVRQLDWHLLSKDLMNGLFLSQQELADLCKVSQQSISNWKRGFRNPGVFARQKLFELAQKEKIDLSKYETNSTRDAITKLIAKDNGKEITRLLDIYQKMSKGARIKFLRYGNSLLK